METFITARLTTPLPVNDERQDYLRATLTEAADGMREITPFNMQDSSMQRTLQSSNALILREPFVPAALAGSLVKALLLDF